MHAASVISSIVIQVFGDPFKHDACLLDHDADDLAAGIAAPDSSVEPDANGKVVLDPFTNQPVGAANSELRPMGLLFDLDGESGEVTLDPDLLEINSSDVQRNPDSS